MSALRALRRRLRPRRNARGMTLLEVLIAGGILVFGMVGVLALFNAAARTHKRAVDETHAVQLGASVMSDLRALFEKGVLPNGTPPGVPQENADFPGYKYAVQIIDLQAKGGRRVGIKDQPGQEFFVEVRVYFPSRGKELSIPFHTVMVLRTE